jgi:hypothetical protein
LVLAPQTIEALADVISGGPGTYGPPPLGLYRTAYELGKFMRGCNVDFKVDGSRLPSLTTRLMDINRSGDMQTMSRIVEHAADPRDFIKEPEKGQKVLDHLNQFLAYDGYQLERRGLAVKLIESGKSTPVLDHLATKVEVLNFDTVRRDLDRALGSAKDDPEDAVTAACSTVESVCRSVLVELRIELPSKKDITSLYKAVRDPLGLSPDRMDLPPLIADDVRKVLSGLATTIDGIGALRTHAGDAHGREKGYRRIDERIAKLAIHSASTVALFVLETWEIRFPTAPLPRH